MAAKTETQEIQVEELPKALVELLNELIIVNRTFNPKKATLRQVKRNMATLKAIISDIDEEVSNAK